MNESHAACSIEDLWSDSGFWSFFHSAWWQGGWAKRWLMGHWEALQTLDSKCCKSEVLQVWQSCFLVKHDYMTWYIANDQYHFCYPCFLGVQSKLIKHDKHCQVYRSLAMDWCIDDEWIDSLIVSNCAFHCIQFWARAIFLTKSSRFVFVFFGNKNDVEF